MNTAPSTSGEPQPGQWLAAEDFAKIVRLTPLVSIDIAVRAPDRRVLVGRRKFEPARNTFFLVGGRITKNESQAAAFRRLTREAGALFLVNNRLDLALLSEAQLLASPEVHENTKAYFR